MSQQRKPRVTLLAERAAQITFTHAVTYQETTFNIPKWRLPGQVRDALLSLADHEGVSGDALKVMLVELAHLVRNDQTKISLPRREELATVNKGEVLPLPIATVNKSEVLPLPIGVVRGNNQASTSAPTPSKKPRGRPPRVQKTVGMIKEEPVEEDGGLKHGAIIAAPHNLERTSTSAAKRSSEIDGTQRITLRRQLFSPPRDEDARTRNQQATALPTNNIKSQFVKEGDWVCGDCGNHNFAWRDVCHRCPAVKPDNQRTVRCLSSTDSTSATISPPGTPLSRPGSPRMDAKGRSHGLHRVHLLNVPRDSDWKDVMDFLRPAVAPRFVDVSGDEGVAGYAFEEDALKAMARLNGATMRNHFGDESEVRIKFVGATYVALGRCRERDGRDNRERDARR